MEDFSKSLAKSLSSANAVNPPEPAPLTPKSVHPVGHEDLDHLDLDSYYGLHLHKTNVYRNPAVPILYEEALRLV